jgi:hypothetical protein
LIAPATRSTATVPYRTHHVEPPQAPDTRGDDDLLPIALVFWIASVAVCAHHLLEHLPFTREAELAAICVLFVPLVALRSIKKV